MFSCCLFPFSTTLRKINRHLQECKAGVYHHLHSLEYRMFKYMKCHQHEEMLTNVNKTLPCLTPCLTINHGGFVWLTNTEVLVLTQPSLKESEIFLRVIFSKTMKTHCKDSG